MAQRRICVPAKQHDVIVVDYDMITALGKDAQKSWDALLAGKAALAPDARFYPADTEKCYPVGVADAVDNVDTVGRSRFMRVMAPLLPTMGCVVPQDAKLILATTVGEIDLLEANREDGKPLDTLAHVREQLGLERPGLLLSAACASSTAALATAAEWIASGRESCVCVLGCDALSEFVYSGFLSLQALSSGVSRPFAPDRDGLNLGEGAGFMLLMSDERARKERRWRQGRLAGWGSTCDAFHATSPDPDARGLIRAIRAALARAKIKPHEIASICAHGTATPFNDAMEERAFTEVFKVKPPPKFLGMKLWEEKPPLFYSVKGAVGHTLGAAGVIEAIFTLLAVDNECVPPNVGNANLPHRRTRGYYGLTTNSGFGGINTALVFFSYEISD
jgi:3-oxoacyl-[acyl-carrier-protein] synthase II